MSARTRARRLAAALLLAVAIAWVLVALATIAAYALRYPAFDQYRLYEIYLGLPFPENAVQLENGHRPILPALLRLAEIRWLDADQMLQNLVGIAAALAALAVIAGTLLREQALDPLARAAGVLAAVLAIFWLGNARVLMHGNESVQMYFVVFFLVLGIAVLSGARAKSSTLAAAAAALCALAATFSFGTGMAAFAALLLLAAVLRLPARALAILAVAAALALGIYALALPGGTHVRGMLALDPADNVAVVLRWLASPWMFAWLGNGDPLLATSSKPTDGSLTFALFASARALAAPFGDQALMRESFVVGALGVAAFAAALRHAWRQGAALSRLRCLALGLSTFALGAALIVCLARLHTIATHPGEVFADRYLPWSCLFWLGLALYAIAGASRGRGLLISAVATLLVAVILTASQRSQAGWSATIHRNNQQSAVAAQLGIWDPLRLPDDDSARRSDALRSLALLRERRLSMFSEPVADWVGAPWRAAGMPAPAPGGEAHVDRVFDDDLGRRRVAAFEGLLPKLRALPRDPVLVVVGADGALRGLAKLSFIGYSASSLRLDRPRWRGFDGYVLDPKSGETLTILVFDAKFPGDPSRDRLGAITLRIPDDSGS